MKSSAGVTLVPTAQIDWIEAAADYVRLHTAERSYLHRAPIGHLEVQLDPAKFVRVHRTTIVNLARCAELKSVRGDSLVAVLPNGVRRPVSRQGRAQLERALGQRL